MGSEIWALVGVVVGALIAGVLQIVAGSFQRKHDRKAYLAGKRYDVYMHVLQDAARIKVAASDLFGIMTHPHAFAEEITSRQAFNGVNSEFMTNQEMHWALSSDKVKEAMFEMTGAIPGIDCQRPDGSWDAELAAGRLERFIKVIARLTTAVANDLQVDELLGGG
jgi:hypothetical protein